MPSRFEGQQYERRETMRLADKIANQMPKSWKPVVCIPHHLATSTTIAFHVGEETFYAQIKLGAQTEP